MKDSHRDTDQYLSTASPTSADFAVSPYFTLKTPQSLHYIALNSRQSVPDGAIGDAPLFSQWMAGSTCWSLGEAVTTICWTRQRTMGCRSAAVVCGGCQSLGMSADILSGSQRRNNAKPNCRKAPPRAVCGIARMDGKSYFTHRIDCSGGNLQTSREVGTQRVESRRKGLPSAWRRSCGRRATRPSKEASVGVSAARSRLLRSKWSRDGSFRSAWTW